MQVTIKFTNDHGVQVTLRGKCDRRKEERDPSGYFYYPSKSENMADVHLYYDDDSRIWMHTFYFYTHDEYGEDYEVHAFYSVRRECWVVSHITAYGDDGEQLYEIGGRTQDITINVR